MARARGGRGLLLAAEGCGVRRRPQWQSPHWQQGQKWRSPGGSAPRGLWAHARRGLGTAAAAGGAAAGGAVDWESLVASSRDRGASKDLMRAKLAAGTYFSAVVPELTARVVLAPEDLERGYYNLADTGAIFDLALEELVSGSGHPVETATDFVAVGGICGMSHALVGLALLLGQSVPLPGVAGRLAPTLREVEGALAAARDGSDVAEFVVESGGDAAALRNPNNERHMEALLALAGRDAAGACATWENAVLANPWDVLAVFCLQETYLRSGDARSALACVERVLGCWDPSTPNYSRLIGLHAAGLFECGFMSEAEEAAGRALALSTDNVRATRATARGLHRSGRMREGLRLLRELDESLEDVFDGASVSHLSHELDAMRCAFHVETGKVNNALAVVDSCFMDFVGSVESVEEEAAAAQTAPAAAATASTEAEAEVFPPLVSAASALWRLHLAGVNEDFFRAQSEEREELQSSWNIFASASVTARAERQEGREGEALESRFQRVLALVLDGYESEATRKYGLNVSSRHRLKLSEAGFLSPEPLAPMADVYKTVLLVGSGELGKARKLVAKLEEHEQEAGRPAAGLAPGHFRGGPSFAPSRPPPQPATCTQVCRALVLLGGGDAAAACDLLMAARGGFAELGGTFEHVDLLEQTLAFAALSAAKVPTAFLSTDPEEQDPDAGAEDRARLWVARALVYERTQRQSLSPQSWDWRARVQYALGQKHLGDASKLRSTDLGFRQGGSNQH